MHLQCLIVAALSVTMAELLVASAEAAKPAGAAPSGTLRAPVLLQHDGIPIEVSVHASPRAVMRELQHMFSGKKLKLGDRVLALPTTQHTAMELVNWGDDAAVEKDRCLECFVAFAESLRGALAARGHWCDFIDPCSGLPCHCKECTSIYDEVSGHQCLLKYAVSQAAGCKVLLHPKWGTACYPATIFTTAPDALVLELLDAYPRAATEVVA